MRKLVLEDGSVFVGRAFGGDRTIAGEVVFATGMSGYVETLTDPSYRGQIVVLTYPLQGNYGVPPRGATATPAQKAAGAHAVQEPFESARIQVQALVVLRAAAHPSHHGMDGSLSSWLAEHDVPGLEGIDTRALTVRLREHGVMRGLIVDGDEQDIKGAWTKAASEDMEHVCAAVSPPGAVLFEAGPQRIMLVDCGAKASITRSLRKRGASVLRVSFQDDLSKYIDQVDGILLSNGPGDPKDMAATVAQIRNVLLPSKKPLFGVCLGNQLLALAAGGDTMKLKYGHRSQNQPVQDLLTRRSYVTSQNHGYVVREDSLPKDFSPWFVNINDGSNEGIRSSAGPWSSVQFHPEASPGPEDAAFLFDDFLRLTGSMRAGLPPVAPVRGSVARIEADLHDLPQN